MSASLGEFAIDATTNLPTGTVTFLFTDIEGSTRLLQRAGGNSRAIIEAHNELVRKAIEDTGGIAIRTEGDSFFAVFAAAPAAVAAAVEAQRALADHEFAGGEKVQVRMGLHTGIGAVGGDDYVGIDVHRAARISAAGHGGQVLASAATMSLAEHSLPPGVVARDLGEHVLRDLDTPVRLFRLVIAGLPDNQAAPRSLSAVRDNLPTQLSSFVGRRDEVRQAQSLLAGSRLLTLTGPGGTGKSRLALELARMVSTDFADGAHFVALAGIADPEEVPAKILESFSDHVAQASTPTEDHLLAYVARRNLLLVLDNFEHLIAAAPIALRILQASIDTKIIATSRTPLRLAGEQEMPIPPLATPDLGAASAAALMEVDSVALFADRAKSVRPSFVLDDRAAQIVAELVARLDGLPLAIELAASRVRTLSPRAILENLEHVMAGEGSRDLPARQRTMDHVIAWSYDLLPEPAQTLLAAMAVFAGGAGLEQISAVAGPELGNEPLQGLETLVEHSLVVRSEAAGDVRFRMLEVVRQFAERKLAVSGRMAETAERHARAYARLSAAAEPNLTGSGASEWLSKLSADHDNLRKAQQWAVEHDEIDMAFEMAASLWRFYHMRGLLFSAGGLLQNLLLIEGASIASRAKALEAAGGVAYWSGDMESAREFYEEALGLFRILGEPGPIAYALCNLAFARNYEGDAARARALFGEAHAMFADLGDEAGMAAARWGLGDAWAASGELVEARHCFDESVAAFERLDDRFGLGWALYTQGEVLVRLGEYESARRHLQRGMRLFDISDVSAVVMYLAAFAYLAIERGDSVLGARLAGAMTGLRDETGVDLVRVGISATSHIDPDSLGLLDGELGAVYAEGRTMSVTDAVALALADSGGD
jgi:predicted ATPase/class 3 adenylate cyclase